VFGERSLDRDIGSGNAQILHTRNSFLRGIRNLCIGDEGEPVRTTAF
jgi:hypothetical protein